MRKYKVFLHLTFLSSLKAIQNLGFRPTDFLQKSNLSL